MFPSPNSIASPPGTLEILIDRDTIQARVGEMGAQIGRDYGGGPLVLLGVLKGAAFFLADLARAIPRDCTFDFLAVSSYGRDTSSSGRVTVLKDTDAVLEGADVLLVEDILDTGITLNFLRGHLQLRRPRSLRIAALLDKPARRREPLTADYVGFTIPDRFVVGYGMDYAEKYRNLPDIYCVHIEAE
jgi:hypoxanthine phosphoribosyltransferase